MTTKPVQAKVYSIDGKAAGTFELPASVFGVEPKKSVLWEAVRAQLANRRKAIAHTKTKGEVRGGGKKPWKQKGTGRARHGSTRNPQWSGGGVAFGPRSNRNFSLKINAQVKRLALRMALTDRALGERIIIVEDMSSASGKTKQMAALVKTLSTRRPLVVVMPKQPQVVRALRNIPKMTVAGATSLNVVDVLDSDYIIIPKEAMESIVTVYGSADKGSKE